MLTRKEFLAATMAAGVMAQLGAAPAYGATHIQDAPSMARARAAVMAQDHRYLNDRQILDALLHQSHQDHTPVLIPRDLAAQARGEITRPGWAVAEISRNSRGESEVLAVYDNDQPQVGIAAKIDAALAKAFEGGQDAPTQAERVESAIKASEDIVYSVDAVKEMGRLTKPSLTALLAHKMVNQEMLQDFKVAPLNTQTLSQQVTVQHGHGR